MLQKLSATIKSSIKDQTRRILFQNNVILVFYFVFVVVTNILIVWLRQEKMKQCLMIDKNIVMLIPQYAYIDTQHLQSEVNIIMKKYNLVED